MSPLTLGLIWDVMDIPGNTNSFFRDTSLQGCMLGLLQHLSIMGDETEQEEEEELVGLEQDQEASQ